MRVCVCVCVCEYMDYVRIQLTGSHKGWRLYKAGTSGHVLCFAKIAEDLIAKTPSRVRFTKEIAFNEKPKI